MSTRIFSNFIKRSSLKFYLKSFISKILAKKFILKILSLDIARTFLKQYLNTGKQMFFLQGFKVPIIVSCKSGNGIEFLLKTSINDDHFRSAFLDNLEEWESNVTAQFVNSIRLDASIIDVGAYSGVFSILGAKVGAKRIIAIEPNGRVFPLLEQNIRINSLENYVTCLNFACSDYSGFDKLLIPEQRYQSSGAQLSKATTNRDLTLWSESQEIELVTLDEIVSIYKLAKIDLVKIDVEGSELSVLKGSARILKEYKPKIFIELLNENTKKEIMEFLETYSYGLPTQLDATNYLFEYSAT